MQTSTHRRNKINNKSILFFSFLFIFFLEGKSLCNVISCSLFVEESGGVCHINFILSTFFKKWRCQNCKKTPVVHILLVLYILQNVIIPFCHISTQKAFMHLIYIVPLKLLPNTDLQYVFSFLSAFFFLHMCNFPCVMYNHVPAMVFLLQKYLYRSRYVGLFDCMIQIL